MCCCAIEHVYELQAASAVSVLVCRAYERLHANRHIDCAAAYGNENVVGEALGNVFKEGKVSRKDVWITSKLNNPDHGRVREACQQTIKELQAEYLDLYLMHWPLTGNKGKEVEPPIKVSVTKPPVLVHLLMRMPISKLCIAIVSSYLTHPSSIQIGCIAGHLARNGKACRRWPRQVYWHFQLQLQKD